MLAPFSQKIDLWVSHLFYNGSYFDYLPLHYFLSKTGNFPSLVLGEGAGILLLWNLYNDKNHAHKLSLEFLSFSLLLGAGILVNVVMKNIWPRPRPVQILEFGGSYPFTPFFAPLFSLAGKAKSFPSGHCVMGFYFFNLSFLGYRLKKPLLLWTGLILGLFMGSLLSWCRLAMGAHFFSDVFMAFIFSYYVALFAT